MIRYTLQCAEGHRFESWFQSAEAFDALRARGMVCCTLCGSAEVEKGLMAPSISPARAKAATPGENSAGPLSTPAGDIEKAIMALKRHIAETSDYVGLRFAQEVRDMHAGLIPDRPIHGEAKPEEARKLLEEGIPVAPLPFASPRKTN